MVSFPIFLVVVPAKVACQSTRWMKGLSTNNAEIAAMFAPKPQLVISDGSDWTQTVPEIEFPYLKTVYSLYGKAENIENAHLPNDQHDYGPTKRFPMYRFVAVQF